MCEPMRIGAPRRVRSRAASEDVARRIDAHREPGLLHQPAHVRPAGEVGVGVRGARDAALRVGAEAGELGQRRVEPRAVDAHGGGRAARGRAATERPRARAPAPRARSGRAWGARAAAPSAPARVRAKSRRCMAGRGGRGRRRGAQAPPTSPGDAGPAAGAAGAAAPATIAEARVAALLPGAAGRTGAIAERGASARGARTPSGPGSRVATAERSASTRSLVSSAVTIPVGMAMIRSPGA
jgi:hypothetical protein